MFPYNAGQYNRQTFEPIPEGVYKVKIVNAKQQENYEKTRRGISVTYMILDGDYVGRLIFDNFYIQNLRPIKDEDIDKKNSYSDKEKNRLNGLMRAINKTMIYNPSNLDNSQLQIKAIVTKTTEKYKAKNRVVDYFPFNHQIDDLEQLSEQKNNNDIPF